MARRKRSQTLEEVELSRSSRGQVIENDEDLVPDLIDFSREDSSKISKRLKMKDESIT